MLKLRQAPQKLYQYHSNSATEGLSDVMIRVSSAMSGIIEVWSRLIWNPPCQLDDHQSSMKSIMVVLFDIVHLAEGRVQHLDAH